LKEEDSEEEESTEDTDDTEGEEAGEAAAAAAAAAAVNPHSRPGRSGLRRPNISNSSSKALRRNLNASPESPFFNGTNSKVAAASAAAAAAAAAAAVRFSPSSKQTEHLGRGRRIRKVL